MRDKVCVIYIGNRLQGQGLNPTTVDILGDKLEIDINLIRASHYKNPLVRLLHMWYVIFVNFKTANCLLIDTYSTSAFNFAWTSGKVAQFLSLKYIPFLHGGDLPNRFKSHFKKCNKFFLNAHSIVSPSDFLKYETEKQFDVNVTVIPNYLEIEFYAFKERKVSSRVNLLWVRAFDEIYNPKMAVDTVSALLQRGVPAKLTMIGPDKDGSMETTKEYIQKLGLENNVTITGRMAKNDWIKKSSAFHFFINTTNADNTPVSVMEAMALGFPVITTNVGGIPFLFEDKKEGVLVPPNNAESMANAIINLMSSPQKLEDLSLNARKKAENWDWNVVRSKWLNILAK